ncbi:MAG TPA: TlpA disulfide reductase family protein [Bacteroidia bacterium]|nr:TlpA disulfide reductase family protein [Bacteroidia bacterium]
MRNFKLHFIFMFLLLTFVGEECEAQRKTSFLNGYIYNYFNQPLYIYQCYGDTLLLIDSTVSDKHGGFVSNFGSIQNAELNVRTGLYKVVLLQNQYFYILYNGAPVEIKTTFQPSAFYNVATDSLTVLKSDENKQFYKFQLLQKQINIANYWLLQMMRLYPLSDPFHKQIEKEYFNRYKSLEQFVLHAPFKEKVDSNSILIAMAYYQPVLPDWKQPDSWRDSILALHYFDYFNPATSFYLNTNILPEKIDLFLKISSNKTDKYGESLIDEKLMASAAQIFLEKTRSNDVNFNFCLNYLLKKFSSDHLDNAFLSVYDNNSKPQTGDCKSGIVSENIKKRAGELKKIAINSIAPDFNIGENLNLSGIQSEYVLLVFWASWCPHCTAELPEIKKAVAKYNERALNAKLVTLAVSLDTDRKQWQNYITSNQLFSFLNFSELKGWQSEVVKKYNVFATPTMFLLDKQKKIIAKPETSQQLISAINMAEQSR